MSFSDPIATPRPGRRPRGIRRRHARGVSLIEAIIALAISAVLLTATMVATDASFRSYANAAEQASTQAASRMVMYRLLAIFRTSRGEFDCDSFNAQPGTFPSTWVEFIDAGGQFVRVEWRSDVQQLWHIINPDDPDTKQESVLLGGVSDATFTLVARRDDSGLVVMERITVDMTVEADDDATLDIETHRLPPIRLIASTMPRKLN